VVVDGVDLVVVNADLDGCLRHFLVGPDLRATTCSC